MKPNTRRFVAIAGIGLALLMPMNRAFADADFEKQAFEGSESFNQSNTERHRRVLSILSAEWWQWALSIPASVNPLTDASGTKAAVGQRGPVWFLAGTFGGGTATRTCSVPEGKLLFFPVVNIININTPHMCGQQGSQTASELRAAVTPLIDEAAKANPSATLDGKAITNLQRVQSPVFAVALPEGTVYDCAPPGLYSPCVADGYYVLLDPLNTGEHRLRFHGEIPSLNFVQDVTYNLTVVAVSLTK